MSTSEQFLDLESRLDDLLQNIDRIKKDRNSNVTNIEEMKTRLVKEIRQKRAEINKRLDNLEKQIIKDLEEKKYQSKERIQKVLLWVKEKETIIRQCQANFQEMKQYASDLQTFLGIKEIEMNVYENERYLHSLIEAKCLEPLDLVWKVDPSILTSLKNFGSIEMKTQTSNIEFTRGKDKQAQLQVVTAKKNIDDVNLILQKTIITDVDNIRGCCMSEEGDFLYTDYQYEYSSVTVIAADNRLKLSMILDPSYGFDIALIDEKTVAITTGNSEKQIGIDIIDIKNQRKIKFIELPGRPYGITMDHDSLFVCVEGHGIYKVNTLNYASTHVISCNLPSHSYVSIFSDNIYYTNNVDNSVVCCDRNGSCVLTFKDELVLNDLGGIAVHNYGNVYVVGEESSNVLIISKDGKHHKQILTENDGLQGPTAISLYKENKKLLVTNTSNTAVLYPSLAVITYT